MIIILPSEKGGSHQHYWHFMLGNVLPLFHAIGSFSEQEQIVSFDPGPLKHILTDLGITVLTNEEYIAATRDLARVEKMHKRGSRNYNANLTMMQRIEDILGRLNPATITPQLVHINNHMYAHVVVDTLVPTDTKGTHCIRFTGFDKPDRYHAEHMRGAARRIVERLGIEARPGDGAADDEVIFIDRAPPHSFYATYQAHGQASGTGEGHTAGTQRRSIGNANALVDALRQHCPVRVCYLEHMSLREQIELFLGAKQIICQQGAALANLVWARPGMTLIEISPSAEDSSYWIEPLVEQLSLQYHRVLQDGNHGDVPVQPIIDQLSGVAHCDP